MVRLCFFIPLQIYYENIVTNPIAIIISMLFQMALLLAVITKAVTERYFL